MRHLSAHRLERLAILVVAAILFLVVLLFAGSNLQQADRLLQQQRGETVLIAK